MFETNTAINDAGLATPGNSQEVVDVDVDCDSPDTEPTYNVEWIDTDVSEDEDYLPQDIHRRIPSPPRRQGKEDRKRARVPSTSSICEPSVRRRLQVDVDMSPAERVRRAVDKVIDTADDCVDLSYADLSSIPDDIKELRYVTVLHKENSDAATLKLFLAGNALTHLNPLLFTIKNLSVLSLRKNHLIALPPEIALLENLVELSIGNNMLEYLPAELLLLKKLQVVSLCPNPFLPPATGGQRQIIHEIPSLVEISSRHYLNNRQSDIDTLPFHIQEQLASVPAMNLCHQCRLMFKDAAVREIIWHTLFDIQNVPLLYRFCSIQCNETFHRSQQH